jgi:heme/copper-type cytochrome/quinol oxidase subunit 2
MNARVVLSLVMMMVWLGLFAYFLVRYEHFRDPFSGEPMVLLLWLLVPAALIWNALRAYYSWKPSRPPIRRPDE